MINYLKYRTTRNFATYDVIKVADIYEDSEPLQQICEASREKTRHFVLRWKKSKKSIKIFKEQLEKRLGEAKQVVIQLEIDQRRML